MAVQVTEALKYALFSRKSLRRQPLAVASLWMDGLVHEQLKYKTAVSGSSPLPDPSESQA